MLDSLISPEAKIGKNVQIGFRTRIYGTAEIGEDTKIGDHCIIGHPSMDRSAETPVVIGAGSIIRSHSIIYEGSYLGPYLETGHHVVIREGTRVGNNLRVGNFSDIEGNCEVGDYCRFHGYVHVGRGSNIGHFVWLFSLVTLTNDPLPPSNLSSPVTVEDGVVVCVGAIVLPGAVLQQGSFVSAGTKVGGTVPSGAVVDGPRGEVVSHVTLLAHLESGTRHPWMRHFRDRYPVEAHARIQELYDEILRQRPKS